MFIWNESLLSFITCHTDEQYLTYVGDYSEIPFCMGWNLWRGYILNFFVEQQMETKQEGLVENILTWKGAVVFEYEC
jgi:hypothetical protein